MTGIRDLDTLNVLDSGDINGSNCYNMEELFWLF